MVPKPCLPRWPPRGAATLPAMEPREYQGLDATDLAGLVARKEVTAAELLALARERSDAVNPMHQRRRDAD